MQDSVVYQLFQVLPLITVALSKGLF